MSVFTFVLYLPLGPFFARAGVQKVTKELSSATPGLYILHPMVFNFLNTHQIAASIGVRFPVILYASTLIPLLLKRIPGIRACI